MTPTWFAVNNQATLEDVPDLAAIGIKIGRRSPDPVRVFRDPSTGRLLAEIGTVHVYRDGRVWIIPRSDCPDGCLRELVRTAVDCVERDLHRRDRWHYYRPTKTVPVGEWSSVIAVWGPELQSVFAAHAAMLQPAALPGDRATSEQLHQRA
ncbi:hypothetical protein [Brachybacterium sp. p3-SID957]|uniref:hypothetical protein n=1 Tax=Brachybacterium sp. p3-SID957 TaxID=2916049 RepID=UPI00223AF189|nr:hypothetical protein [Brachybacterium sp. p3-SID957]MCT1776770.1 hypothetical protein [Brachybacterium sp. p3-SID957]